MSWSLANKVACWRQNINTKSLIHMHSFFFNCAAYTKLSFLQHLCSELLLTSGNSGNCLESVNMTSNVGWCGDGLLKKLRIK